MTNRSRLAAWQIVLAGNHAVRSIGIAAVEGSAADGMESGLPSDAPRVVQAHHVRHHDSGGVHLQGMDQVAVAAARNAHHGVHVVGFGGPDLVLDVAQVVGHVFAVEPDAIHPAQGGDLRHAGIGQIELDATGHFARPQLSQALGSAASASRFSFTCTCNRRRRECLLPVT